MKDEQCGSVKILFRFFNEYKDEWIVETLWAKIIDSEKGLYKLDNIPFYASVSCDDVVFAEYDENEKKLTYRKTIIHSGKSTIQINVIDKSVNLNKIREMFSSLDCDSEKFNDEYFVMEIPEKVNYNPIRVKLNELEEKGIIIYAEPNLSSNHWY
jgi:hypothetical protein